MEIQKKLIYALCMSEKLPERLVAARKAAGYATPSEAAVALGIPYPTLTSHENGSRGIGRALDAYVSGYNVSADWLLHGKGSGPAASALPSIGSKTPRSNASFPPRYQQFPDATVPLLGQSVAGPNGRFMLNGQEVGRVFCPPDLEGVEGAYAVMIYGTSGEPRFFAGETAWINPHLPVRAGDDVVAQIYNEEGDAIDSYVKRFVSMNARLLKLYQYNPDEGETNELEFDAARVFSVHKIVFHAML